MKVQFLYHPVNDAFIAEKIIDNSGVKQTYALSGLKISDINTPNEELIAAIEKSDVVVLLIGSTFDRVAPYVWMNPLQHFRAMFGINIHRFPDEWGEARKSSGKIFDRIVSTDGGRVGVPFDVYDLPEDADQLSYIRENFEIWCTKAITDAEANYGIT